MSSALAFVSYRVIGEALGLVLAIILVHAVLSRWRSDLDEFRTTNDGAAQVVLAGLRAVMLLLVVFLAQYRAVCGGLVRAHPRRVKSRGRRPARNRIHAMGKKPHRGGSIPFRGRKGVPVIELSPH